MSDTPPNDARFRRFMTFQIILHWIVALPYMFLLLTGALLMLSRLGLAKWVLPQLVVPMHKVVGIAMAVLIVETLLAALVGGYWRSVGRDVLHWVSVVWHDVVWLVKVPLNTFFPRQFPLPPAGRFNAGQKLHGLFILCEVGGFIVTGFMMIFRPAWLPPWMIHTWLFFGEVGILGLHLFLGLINPVTRRRAWRHVYRACDVGICAGPPRWNWKKGRLRTRIIQPPSHGRRWQWCAAGCRRHRDLVGQGRPGIFPRLSHGWATARDDHARHADRGARG